MENIFFTADHHFGHKNIIKFCNRPFGYVDEMNEFLIQRWNDKVGHNDKVYHLGDLGLNSPDRLREILNRLNGKIYLIKGNHEKSAVACRDRFEWIKEYHELIVNDDDFHKGKQLIVLFHYALREWNASHHGTFHLYGHSHGTLEDLKGSRSFDVGVDCHDYSPISYLEVKRLMSLKDWRSPFKNPAS